MTGTDDGGEQFRLEQAARMIAGHRAEQHAKAVADELKALDDARLLRADKVIGAARVPTSAMHEHFTWNATDERLREEACRLIEAVHGGLNERGEMVYSLVFTPE